MKGGDVLALGVARALAARPEDFAELAVLLVTDEEWRVSPFVHAGPTGRFSGYDACLCFEAGERGPNGEEGVVVRRKAAGTLKVTAHGRASHSGSAPDQGRNALLALAATAQAAAAHHDPKGPDQLSVVPTVMRSGGGLQRRPGRRGADLRRARPAAGAHSTRCWRRYRQSYDGVRSTPTWSGCGRAWTPTARTAELIEAASRRLGRTIVGVPRGGASDASHFADTIPLTVDGLGPRGGGAHTPEEFVLEPSLRQRAEVALAVAVEVLHLPSLRESRLQ